MATSIGGAISEGLDSGLRLGLGLRDRDRQQRRQDEQDAFERDDRGLRLADRQTAIEDRQRVLKRQERADRFSALQGQEASVRSQLSTLPAGDTSPRAQQLLERHRTLSAVRDKELAGAGGYDFAADERDARADVEALAAGRGAELTPARRVRALAATSRRDLADFRRGPNGEPSKVGAAVEDFGAGLSGGDHVRMLRGANILLKPDLESGIGQDSPHGGKIVGKEVIAFDQAPNSSPDDPQLVPRLKVWVKGPDPKTDEEKRLLARWAASHPEIPAGATGFYEAPVTEDRSSRPDAPVKMIGMKAGMQYLSGLKQMEEWLNDPAVAADIDAGAGQWDQARFLRERQAAGLGSVLKTTAHSIGSGGLALITHDERGREVKREVIANQNPNDTPEMIAAKIKRLEEQADLDRRTDPNRRGRGGGGGAGGGAAKVRSTKVGPSGNILLVMSDGTVKDTGQKDASFGRTIANLTARLAKDDYKFQRLSTEEQRARVLDLLVADEPSAPAGGKLSDAPAGAGATPVPAPSGGKRTAPDFSSLWSGGR